MTLIGQNQDMLGIIEQAKNLFEQNSGSTEASKGSSYGDIAWFNEAISSYGATTQIATGDHNQKVNGIKNLVDTAMSLLSKLGASEAAKAKAEATKDKKAAQKYTEEIDKAQADFEKNVEQQVGFVDDQSCLVKESIGELEKANEQIQEKQEEINEIIKQINDLQSQLAGKTPEEQAQILGQIQTLSGQLATTAASIADVQETVENASAQVENAVTNIESAQEGIVALQEHGQQLVQEKVQQGVQEIQKNVQRQVQGKVNEATGTAAEKAAQTAGTATFGIGSGVAVKLYKVSFDQEMAGTTRQTSSSQNLKTIMTGIGEFASVIPTLLTNHAQAIGNSMNEFNGYIGSWNTALEPVITSIGSFTGEEGVIATNEQLKEAVTVDLNTLGATVDENGNVENKNTDNNKNEDSKKNEQLVKPELFTPNVKFKEFEVEKK